MRKAPTWRSESFGRTWKNQLAASQNYEDVGVEDTREGAGSYTKRTRRRIMSENWKEGEKGKVQNMIRFFF